MSELLSASTPGPDKDSDMPLEPSTMSEEPLFCDTGAQVVTERKKMPVSRLLKGPRLVVRIGDSFTELLVVDYHQH